MDELYVEKFVVAKVSISTETSADLSDTQTPLGHKQGFHPSDFQQLLSKLKEEIQAFCSDNQYLVKRVDLLRQYIENNDTEQAHNLLNELEEFLEIEWKARQH